MESSKIPYSFDLHTHHDLAMLRDYVEVAIKNGLDMLDLSDHSPHFYSEDEQLHPKTTVGKSEFQHYIREVLGFKEEYKDKIETLLDDIISSVHYVDGINIFEKGLWEGLTSKLQPHPTVCRMWSLSDSWTH